MAGVELPLAQGRHGGEIQGGLGDEITGIGLNLGGKFENLGLLSMGSNQHAVAACLRHRLHHQVLEVGEHVGTIVGPGAQIGGHIFDNRLLPQVVADHLGHIGVDELVIGHTAARGVGDGHPAGRIGRHQAPHPQHRITAEHGRIEEVVVDAPVNHIHRFEAGGTAHPDPVALADQITPFHQLDAHLLGQVAVLEVGAVEHPRRQQHHLGLVGPGGQLPQGLEQMGGIVVDRLDGATGEQAREHALHHAPVLEEIGHPRRAAQVVLQHPPGADAVADQIQAGDVTPLAQGGLKALQLGPPALGTLHILPGNHPVIEDALVAVDIGQEQVDRFEALDQTPFQGLPFAGADQPGQGIEGQDPLGALVAGIVEPEGGAEALEQHAGGGMVAVQFLDAQGAQGGDQGLESLPGLGATTEIFVVALAGLIGGEHGCPGEAQIMLSDRDDPGLRCYGTPGPLGPGPRDA